MPNGRTSHALTITTNSSTATTDVRPTIKVLRRAASMNWPKLSAGLAIDTAPTMRPSMRIGTATTITEVFASPSKSVLVRAPYWPASASLTSRHCEKSLPSWRPNESNNTMPRSSTTVARNSTLSFLTPKMSASKRLA